MRPWIDTTSVLEVTDDAVTIGDPLTGARTLTHDQFRALWRRTALVLTGAATSEPCP